TRNGTAPLPPASSSTGSLAFPEAADSRLLTLKISPQGGDTMITALGGGVVVASGRWLVDPKVANGYFHELQQATTRERIAEIGNGLWNDLPGAIQDLFLKDQDGQGPISIQARAPYAPFEIMELPTGEEPLLGVRRPVVRWNDAVRTPPEER